MPLRLLARAAPVVLGALAATIWLRRREPEPPTLRPGGPPSARFVRPSPEPRVDILTVVDDLLSAPR